MKPLDSALRRTLRARAHHLGVVVSVGHHGLTPQVLHEIDLALLAHELVKVRVFNDDRDAREAMLERICTELDCSPVQHLGKLLILWRENPDAAAKARDRAHPPKRDDRRSQGPRRRAGGAGKGASRRMPADRGQRVHDGLGRREPDYIDSRRRRRRGASAMSSPLPGPRGPRQRSRTTSSPPSPPAPYPRERRDTANPRRRRSTAPEQVTGATPRKRRRRGA